MKILKLVGGLVLSALLVSGFGVIQTQAATKSYSYSVSAMKAKYAKQIKEYRSIISSNTSSLNGLKKELNGYKELGKTKYDKTLSSLEAKVVKEGKTNTTLSSNVSKFEKDIKAQKNTKKDAAFGNTSASIKKQLVKLKTEISKTKTEITSVGKKKKAEVELEFAKLAITNRIDRDLDAVYYFKTKIQELRDKIEDLLVSTPSQYDGDLKKIDKQLVELGKSNDDLKKEVLTLQKKVKEAKSTSEIAKLYNHDLNILASKFEDLSDMLIEHCTENFYMVSDKIDEVAIEHRIGHYMQHYDEMNLLKEKLIMASTPDEKDADDLRKLLYQKGVPSVELDRVAWSYFNKLQEFRRTNYKVVEDAYDQLQKLATQEDDQAFADQLTMVNGLIDTFICDRNAYAQKEKEAILAKYDGTGGNSGGTATP
ncbi:hypothetical protein [Bacillus sp. FJAT-49736]|uniref:hypothetical protein n=1 Tax=Bacillus sp. FJAT-49736 TaxID=2833582 RepID=UPI001BC96319|nr:hypothetical protein [Bacillus sp. FJAT-49736]MBS4174747.1 hypothetical protein [Bacillus sp. FJAT-49736]